MIWPYKGLLLASPSRGTEFYFTRIFCPTARKRAIHVLLVAISLIKTVTVKTEGGWTHINERGGEMAYLPSGTAIIPADKTDEIINNSTSSSSVTYEDHSTFSPTISITLGGETTKADAEEIVRRVKQAMEDFWQEKKEEEYHERTLQGAYAQ